MATYGIINQRTGYRFISLSKKKPHVTQTGINLQLIHIQHRIGYYSNYCRDIFWQTHVSSSRSLRSPQLHFAFPQSESKTNRHRYQFHLTGTILDLDTSKTPTIQYICKDIIVPIKDKRTTRFFRSGRVPLKVSKNIRSPQWIFTKATILWVKPWKVMVVPVDPRFEWSPIGEQDQSTYIAEQLADLWLF